MKREVTVPGKAGGNTEIIQTFVSAIPDGTPLIASDREGIYSVDLANAMLYSSFMKKPVDLPLNGKTYERHLKKLIRESTLVKKTIKKKGQTSMGQSF